MRFRKFVPFLVTAFNSLLVSYSFAQGSLTPPAPPGPTMKSLDQIEPRIPIDAAHTPGDEHNTFIITHPGSYYLTGNILVSASINGILVKSDNVTIDLNGFDLAATGGLHGILAPGTAAVVIRNGTLAGWSSSAIEGGTDLEKNAGTGMLVENIAANDCYLGISVGDYCLVRNCTVMNSGIVGIYGGTGVMIKDCVIAGGGNGGGIVAGTRALVTACNISDTGGDGIHVEGDSVVRECKASHNAGVGIAVFGSGSRIEANQIRDNAYQGIVAGANDIIIRNSAGSNSGGKNDAASNYSPASGNNFGPIQTPASTTNPNANILF